MRNISTKVRLEDGTITRCKKDLRRLLNLNYLLMRLETMISHNYIAVQTFFLIISLYIISLEIIKRLPILVSVFIRTIIRLMVFTAFLMPFITMTKSFCVYTKNVLKMFASSFLQITHNLEIFRTSKTLFVFGKLEL